MDVVTAKVLGTGALAFGLIFVVTSIVRLTRPDLDVLLVVLDIAFGALLLVTGFRLWRFALRGARSNRDQ